MKNRLHKKFLSATIILAVRPVIATAAASAMLTAMLTGCSAFPDELGNLADQALEASSEETSQLVDSITDKAKEEAKEAAKEYAKGAAQQVSENAQDLAQQAAQEAKDATKQAIEEAGKYASDPDEISSALSSMQTGLLTSTADIALTPQDDQGKNYTFTYDGKEYAAIHTADHWKIKNSYDINSEADMMIICQALIDLHQIHGKDMVSYRTADDMVYEWEVHNLAYAMISDDDPMKSHLRDVDFDPQDQGCSFEEIYYNHTGKELDLSTIFGG